MKHKIGFDQAFAGIKYAFTSQPNFRVHLIFAILAILLANVLSVSQPHWLILIFTICLVFITVMVNTAIESCQLGGEQWIDGLLPQLLPDGFLQEKDE